MTFLDYNSTTPIDPRVFEAMRPWLTREWGNASTREYAMGWDAADAVEEARRSICQLVGTSNVGLIFNSGATESLATVIRGFVGYRDWRHCKLVTCKTEHSAVLEACEQMHRLTQVELCMLPVDHNGLCDLEELRSEVMTENRCLIAVMLANNEIGSVAHVEEIGRIARIAGAKFLCDVTQAVGKMLLDIERWQVDFVAFSSHKVYGPKGVGALAVRKGVEFEPLIVGGGQEQGMRGGTLNVAGIVGFGEACRIADAELADDNQRIWRLRDRLEATLLTELPDIWINGAGAERLCNTSNIGFRGVDARVMIRDMHDIACSTKSACSSGDAKTSHVLKAIGLADDEAYSCIRFSLGRFTTDMEIDYAVEKIIGSVRKLRRINGSAPTSRD
ncbi:MAG: cysteine desulfurase family protein [Aureliella sp.]